MDSLFNSLVDSLILWFVDDDDDDRVLDLDSDWDWHREEQKKI